MDEPFAGVDAATEAAIVLTLRRLEAAGKTVICVHHDLQTVTRYFDHVLLLNMKKIASGRSPRPSPPPTSRRPMAAG
jgi:manganese/zinc/iron transport system ATP- binding protein